MCSSMWDTPILSALSWREAERTHAPNATDRTPGMVSESTVSPFGSVERRSAGARRVSTRVVTRGRDPRVHLAHRARVDVVDGHRARRALHCCSTPRLPLHL